MGFNHETCWFSEGLTKKDAGLSSNFVEFKEDTDGDNGIWRWWPQFGLALRWWTRQFHGGFLYLQL